MKKVIFLSFISIVLIFIFTGCSQPFNPVDQNLINALNEYDDGYLQRNWDAMKNVFEYPVTVESVSSDFNETQLENKFEAIFLKYNGFWLGINYNSSNINVNGNFAIAKIEFSVWQNESKSDIQKENINIYFEKIGDTWKIYKLSRFEIDE